MARKPRIHYPGATYHVIMRGFEGEKVFLNHEDRQHLFGLLKDGVERFHHKIHAFCLLPNRIHFVIQISNISLSRVMQNISFRYTRWVNEQYSRQGPLFHGRYKALVMDADRYLADLVRYLHLMPLVEKRTRKLENYRWSSHRAYLGLEEISWLTTKDVLACFSERKGWQRRKYRAFLEEGKGVGRCGEFHSGTSEGRFLGDEDFSEVAFKQAAKVQKSRVTLNGLVNKIRRMYKISENELLTGGQTHIAAEVRGVVALVVKETPHLSLTDLGKRFDRDITTLSSAANRLRNRAREDELLAKRLEQLNVRMPNIL